MIQNSGEGIGEGVERAVLTSAVKTALSDLSIWTETTDGYKSLSVLPLSNVPPKVRIKIRTHGFVVNPFRMG